MTTVRAVYMRTVVTLRQHQVEDAELVAERLLGHALGVSRTRLLVQWSDAMEESMCVRLRALVDRRTAGVPLEYIIGEVAFLGRLFWVDDRVLIPRPETEQLAQWMMHVANEVAPQGQPVHMVDLGTGSGVLAVTLALAREDAVVYAVDRSGDSLAVAKSNAERCGVAERIAFVEGDWLTPLQEKVPWSECTIVVANPPYIASEDIDRLQREIRQYEPKGALDGGSDGLDAYRAIIAQMQQYATFPDVLGLEVGMGQAGMIAQWLEQCAIWETVEINPDFAGIERYVIAKNKRMMP